MKKVVVMVVMLFFIGGFESVFSQKAFANEAGFSVQAILPENQKTKNISYFDFELLPNMKQTIEIEISNEHVSGEEKVYEVTLNTATTNMNGVIDYTEVEKKRDSSLKLALSDIATVEPTVVVPVGDSVRVPIEIDMPNETFEGILLGGITVIEQEDKTEPAKQQITNQFSYSVGVVISQGDVSPPIELDLLGVKKTQINSRNVIAGTIQNSAATIVNNLSVDARIYRKGQETPLFHRSEPGMRMAPNSNFDFGVGTNDQPLKAGKYTMKVKAVAEEKEWAWEETFEITSKEAKELNETAVALEGNSLSLYAWIGMGLMAMLVTIIIILVLQNKKGRTKNEETNRN